MFGLYCANRQVTNQLPAFVRVAALFLLAVCMALESRAAETVDVASRLGEARKLINAGQFDEATAVCKEPGLLGAGIEVQECLIVAHVAGGKADLANTEMQQMLSNYAKDPKLCSAMVGIAETYWKRSQRAKAKEVLLLAAEKCAGSDSMAEVQAGLAKAALHEGDEAAVRKYLTDLLRDYPSGTATGHAVTMIAGEYKRRGNIARTLEVLDEGAKRLNGVNRLLVMELAGRSHIELRDGKAQAILEDMKKESIAPEGMRSFVAVGEAYFEIGQFARAADVYRWVLANRPAGTPSKIVTRAQLYLDTCNILLADSGGGGSVTATGDSPEIVSCLATGYRKTHRLDRVAAQYTYLVNRWPTHDSAPEAYDWLVRNSVTARDSDTAIKMLSGLSNLAIANDKAARKLLELLDFCVCGSDRAVVDHMLSQCTSMKDRFPGAKKWPLAVLRLVVSTGSDVDATAAIMAAEESADPAMLAEARRGQMLREVIRMRCASPPWPSTTLREALANMALKFKDCPGLENAIMTLGEYYTGKSEEDARYADAALVVWKQTGTETAVSCYCTAVCLFRSKMYADAAEMFQKFVDRWPTETMAWHAQYMVAECYGQLLTARALPEAEANAKIQEACQGVVAMYPQSPAAESAKRRISQ